MANIVLQDAAQALMYALDAFDEALEEANLSAELDSKAYAQVYVCAETFA